MRIGRTNCRLSIRTGHTVRFSRADDFFKAMSQARSEALYFADNRTHRFKPPDSR